MHVSLWERYLYAIAVEGVIHAFQDIADDIRFLRGDCPDKQLEVDAGIGHFRHHALDGFFGIHPLVMEIIDRLLYDCGYLFEP